MARESKQHKCPSTEGRIKIWYIYTMKYCSATKRNKIGSFLEMCMDIETVIELTKSEREKQTLYINTYMWGLEK